MGVLGITRRVRPDEIRTHADLALFPIGQSELRSIIASMRATGYDEAQPIVVWSEQGYVVDGHTRLEAAKQSGLSEVIIYEQSFDGWDEALDYAIVRQRDRRNLSHQQLTSYIAHVVRSSDRLKPQGQRNDLASAEAKSGRSADELAKQIGVSGPTVERVRAVFASDDEEWNISHL